MLKIESLFTGKVLRGGPVSAEEVVDAYINANKALYQTNRNLYEDVKAAKILGIFGFIRVYYGGKRIK